METGVIFHIQKFSVHDGPGLRTTVFFKGCNLRCRWCHNPESWLPTPQMMKFSEKCTGCGLCREVCPSNGEKCTLCGLCTEVCTPGARSITGKGYTTEQVMAQIRADRAFYEKSGGGVTFSGGECMLQPEFLGVLLNQKISPSLLATREGIEKFSMLIRTFFDELKGWHVQYNVVDRETLLDAQQHPENHRDLIVRVAGYSAFFHILSRQTQDDIIGRTEQVL